MVQIHDLLAIGTLIVLEGLLSADNALVLAVLVKHLPEKQRQKALLYGIVGAFVLRFIGLATAKWFVKLWYMKGLGGAYLLYLALRHFVIARQKKQSGPTSRASSGPSFWKSVALLEFTDFAFAMDAILVAVGVSDKLWVIYSGGILGIIAIRIAAGQMLRLLYRVPSLEDMAYVLIGWVSVKMLLGAYDTKVQGPESVGHPQHHLLPPWLFWSVMGLIVVGGVIYAMRRMSDSSEAEPGHGSRRGASSTRQRGNRPRKGSRWQ